MRSCEWPGCLTVSFVLILCLYLLYNLHWIYIDIVILLFGFFVNLTVYIILYIYIVYFTVFFFIG